MAREPPEYIAVRAKSIALIHSTKSRVEQIDHLAFPTATSRVARQLLLDVLDTLASPTNLGAMDSEVLYNRLIKLQTYVDDVEASSSRQISWPLVSYCNEIWLSLFGDKGPGIFYTLTGEYNYKISSYSGNLRVLLSGLLPSPEIDRVVGNRVLYCLHLASLEHSNLPMYANIAHEFGHALYDAHEMEVLQHWVVAFQSVIDAISADLGAPDKQTEERRLKRTIWALISLAEEIFADLAGVLLVGPAFFLSLDEIAWGAQREMWTVRLAPDLRLIRGHPSFNFRLQRLWEVAGLETFAEKATLEFATLAKDRVRQIPAHFATVPRDDSADQITVKPLADSDTAAIQICLSKHIQGIKDALAHFVASCRVYVEGTYGKALAAVEPRSVADLIRRLENDVLPNIIPDGTLLGKPARFAEILNASALFRLTVLAESDPARGDIVAKDVIKVERLTEKALEVSYVQRRFNARKS